MAWLSRNNFTPSDYVHASDLNNLANDMQTWGGNVNGGGYTLSNVVLEGVSASSPVASVFGRTGAVVAAAGDYTAAQVTGAVPNTVQVIAGAGMSGGGALTGNVTLNAAVTSVFGRTGAVTLTPADIAGSQGVTQSRNINTGAGLQGGGNLSSDLTLSVVPGDPTQQVQVLQNGTVVATNHYINFISGANVTVSVTPNTSVTPNRLDVAISSTGGGGGMVDPTTTKGDLIVRGPSITSRLPVGTDGQVLTADSTQSLGVRWGAATGSGAVASVFGRTGAVVATGGDYTAAMVTNAVSTATTYSDPAWLTGLSWSKILSAPTFLVDPTSSKGDLIVRGAAATTRLAVGADGTMLAADSTQANGLRWVTLSVIPSGQYGGDFPVWKQGAGWSILSAASLPATVGMVLTVQNVGASTQIGWQALPAATTPVFSVNGTVVTNNVLGLNLIAGNNTTISGVSNTGNGRADITITTSGPTSGLGDPTTTKGDLLVRSASQVTRLGVGADGTVLIADSTQTLGVKWGAAGSGGGSQTPWTSNIDAAGYSLSNIPLIQSKSSGTGLILDALGAANAMSLQVNGTTMAAVTQANGLTSYGQLNCGVNAVNSAAPQLNLNGSTSSAMWSLTGTASPTTPGTNVLTIQCYQQSAGIYTMNDLGYFGVGKATPAFAVDAAGDCNVTGVYRINGTQLAAAQVTNAVDQTATYPNPAWISSLPWTKITGAPAFLISPLTTKGDIMVFGTTTTRLPVGADGTVLTADSSQPNGLRWGTPAAGGANQTPWTSNINAAGFQLQNAGAIGIGMVPAAGYPIDIYSSSTTATPTVRIVADANVAYEYAQFAGYSYSGTSASAGAWFSGYGARGSQASPGPTQAGDYLVVINSAGYSGSSWVGGAQIFMGAGSNFSATSGETFIAFSTTAAGSTSRAERMRITGAGNVGIGVVNPGNKLSIAGDIFLSDATYDNAVNITPYAYSAGAAINVRNSSWSAAKALILNAGGGNVGIATTTPSYGLDVRSGSFLLSNSDWASGAGSGLLTYFGATSGNTYAVIQPFINGGGNAGNLALNSGGGYIGIGVTDPRTTLTIINPNQPTAVGQEQLLIGESSDNHAYGLSIGYDSLSGAWTGVIQALPAGSPPLVLNPIGGYVGVGTPFPNATLHVKPGTNPDSTGQPAGPWAAIIYNATNNPSYNGLLVKNNWAAANSTVLEVGTDLVGGAFRPYFLVNGIGNVGVNTTSPATGGGATGFQATQITQLNGILVVGETSDGAIQCGNWGFMSGNNQDGGVSIGQNLIYRQNPGVSNYWVSPMTHSSIGFCGIQFYGGSIILTTGGAVATTGGATVTPAEKFRVHSNGNIGMQYASPSYALHLGFDNAAKSSTSTWLITSDARAKRNVRDLSGGIDVINRLRAIEAEYNGLAQTPVGGRAVGFIAQEVEKVLPHCVTRDDNGILGLNIHEILIHLVLAVQQLSKEKK